MLTRHLVVGMILAQAGSTAGGGEKECSQREAQLADQGVDRLRSWADLHQAFKQFGHCDDGVITEGWSDWVVERLANQWKTLPHLNALVSADPGFGDFVIRHIDGTAIWTSAQTAERNAKGRCPKQAAVLCSRIVERVEGLRREGEEKR
jgi:hypothetical protein